MPARGVPPSLHALGVYTGRLHSCIPPWVKVRCPMHITDAIQIPDAELHFTFARSGGPGGQNVNKVASKAILHWNLAGSATLPTDVKDRLLARVSGRLTSDGDLVIQSQRYRDQGRNIEDCRTKLRELILEVLHPPKTRKRTRPGRAAKRRRLEEKRHQARRKAQRRRPGMED
jgi:ribosome-associated protein